MRVSHVAVALFAALQSCQAAGVHPVALAEAGAKETSFEARIEAAVCAGRSACHLESVINGGKSADGHTDLFVAMVGVSSDRNPPCASHDVWVGAFADERATRRQRLLRTCSKEQPKFQAAAPREIRLVIEGADLPSVLDEPHETHFARFVARDFALEPPRLLREFDSAGKTRDYTDAKGAFGRWRDGARDFESSLPMVDAGDAFAAGEWKTTGLGKCSVSFGRNARALLSRGVLYIEVSGEPSPPLGHVRLYLSDPEEMPIRQGDSWKSWRLGMDGHLLRCTKGNGNQPCVAQGAVEMASAGNTRRFRLADLWTRDDRLFDLSYPGVSRTGFSEPGEGAVQEIFRNDAVCVPRAGVLEVVPQYRQDVPFEQVAP